MFGTSYNNEIMRKYFAYFSSLFSGIYVDRETAEGELTARIKVPIHYAKKEHALTRVHDNPDIDRPDAIFVPVMAFDLVDMRYNGERKSPTMNRNAKKVEGNPNAFWTAFVPVQYDFHFQLVIMVKNVNDGLKIVEQIVPWFTPDIAAKLEILPDMGIVHECPLILDSISSQDDVPQAYAERITRLWVLDFTLQGVLYGPVKKVPIIKFTNVEFTGVDPSSNVESTPFHRTTSQPGLTANGEPTSNSSLSVPYLTIYVDDDYGYIVQDTELPTSNG